MIYNRKYCIYTDRDTLGISTLPTDMFHRDRAGTIAGGFISIDTESCEITLSGKSEEFGRPTIEQIIKAVQNNGYYLEKGDKEYTWMIIDELGERIIINESLRYKPYIDLDSTNNEFLQFTDTQDFQLMQSFSDIFPERNHVPVVGTKKIGNNDSCSCGSGKKYKHCCKINK